MRAPSLRPIVRRHAGLHTHKTWRQLLEKRENLAAPQLPKNHRFARRIDAVDQRMLFARSNPIVITSPIGQLPSQRFIQQPQFGTLRCRWWEPPTASRPVIAVATARRWPAVVFMTADVRRSRLPVPVIPKVNNNDTFHGSGSGRPGRRGAQRDACIGQAPQRPRRPDTPHPKGRAILAASRVAHCLLYQHNGATRA